MGSLYRPQGWKVDNIIVDGIELQVRFMPGTNDRFAIDIEGDFFAYNRRDEKWNPICHGAYALLEHNTGVIRWYDNQEIPTLDQVRQQLQEFHAVFMGFLDTSDADREQMQEDMRYLLHKIGSVVDPNKVSAAEQIYCLLPLRDSRGRVNPAVFACRTSKALREFELRIMDVARIKPYIVYYATIVQQFVDEMDARVSQLISQLIRVHQKVDSIKYCSDALKQAIDMCHTISYAKPYRRTALRIEAELRQAMSVLGQPGKKNECIDLIICAGSSLRLKQVRRTLERVILPLLSADLLVLQQKKSPRPNEVLHVLHREVFPFVHRVDETHFVIKVKHDLLAQLHELDYELHQLDRVKPIPREQLPMLRSFVRRAAGML